MQVGRFNSAERLKVDTFKETWDALDAVLEPHKNGMKSADRSSSKLLMYCTGGIRCVKAATYVAEKHDIPEEKIIRLEGGAITPGMAV